MKSMTLAWTAKGMTFPGMKTPSCLSKAVCGAFRKRSPLLIPQQSWLPCHQPEGLLCLPGFTAGPWASCITVTDTGLVPPILALEEHGLVAACLQIVYSTSLKK